MRPPLRPARRLLRILHINRPNLQSRTRKETNEPLAAPATNRGLLLTKPLASDVSDREAPTLGTVDGTNLENVPPLANGGELVLSVYYSHEGVPKVTVPESEKWNPNDSAVPTGYCTVYGGSTPIELVTTIDEATDNTCCALLSVFSYNHVNPSGTELV